LRRNTANKKEHGMDSKDSSDQLHQISLEVAAALKGLEKFQRQFYPLEISSLIPGLRPLAASFREVFNCLPPANKDDQESEELSALTSAAGMIDEALQQIITSDTGNFQETVVQVMRAFRKCCRAQERLYGIRRAFQPLKHHFIEPAVYNELERLDPASPSHPDTGLHHLGTDGQLYTRGALSLYVPESYNDPEALPVVVALHGGFGHGRDFIWTWLREARSRRFILLAPSSNDTTWSLFDPREDGGTLYAMLNYVGKRYRVDMNRVLLTGMSDGGTFALVNTLTDNSPFTAFAPVSSVLPTTNPAMAKGKRIYWVHGALDWMFPVERAAAGSRALENAEADITLEVIEDLAHTYPREANDRILRWFDPALALPSL